MLLFEFWSEKVMTIFFFFFKGCLKAIYGKRHSKQGRGAAEKEEVVEDWEEVREEKLQSSCQEGMVFRAALISALCHFLFPSCYAFSKQWSQT